VNQLAEIMSKVLVQLREEGFELPIQVIVVGACGSIICMEYVQGEGDALDTNHVAERIRPPGLRLPINLILIDSKGDAARVRLGSNGPQDIELLN
jgi:hypothetical protein